MGQLTLGAPQPPPVSVECCRSAWAVWVVGLFSQMVLTTPVAEDLQQRLLGRCRLKTQMEFPLEGEEDLVQGVVVGSLNQMVVKGIQPQVPFQTHSEQKPWLASPLVEGQWAGSHQKG